MSAVIQYFKNIVDSAVSIFDGMTVTFSYMLQKPITVQYPNRLKSPVQTQIADRYRGFLQVDPELCTSCLLCLKECPIDCIQLDGVRIPGRKGKAPYYFFIDIGKCMFCGLCVYVCPTDAIYFTREFEGSARNMGHLIFSYIPEETAREYIKKNIIAEKQKSGAAQSEKGEVQE